MAPDASLATGQRSLGAPALVHPLWPPLVRGCPGTSTDVLQVPLRLEYDHARVDPALFDQPPLPGLERWQPLLPPLAPGLSMGEGGTPLLDVPGLDAWAGCEVEILLKDESRNPTGSHKDRLSLCAVSAGTSAAGIVVASSGNHGAAAAAYAARASLPCVVLMSLDAPEVMQRFVRAHGAAVLRVPAEARWALVDEIAIRAGFHPVSNVTPVHTGHPFGPEGYKTIAYEIFLQMGRRVPGAVLVPTGHAELLFGLWLGFTELRALGHASDTPRMIACEPASRAPLARALAQDRPVARVEARPTALLSIAVLQSNLRGRRAVGESGGAAVPVTDTEARDAQGFLGRKGMWYELSAVAGVAALRRLARSVVGPVVCVVTSSGHKDPPEAAGATPAPAVDPTWPALRRSLQQRYGLRLAG